MKINTPVRTRPSAKRILRPVFLAFAWALAVLPPVLWLLYGQLKQGGTGTTTLAQQDLNAALAVAGFSGALAAVLWWAKLKPLLTALQNSEQQLLKQRRQDPLTGLLNRHGLNLALDYALNHPSMKRQSGQAGQALLMIDIDRFHLINDSLGQPAGDDVLRTAAARIKAVVQPRDLLARIAADRFVLLLDGGTREQALATLARNLLRAFEPACSVGGREMVLSLSMGTATTSATLNTQDEWLKCAELALRAAKTSGGNSCRHFDPSLLAQHDLWLDMESRLRQTFHRGGFALAFQPIMDRMGQQIVAVEALLRWPETGRAQPVSPAVFVPILEQTGLIVPVGRWVLFEACRQGLRWLPLQANALILSVNVSPRQFADPDFTRHVADVLAETGFPANRLQIEVTEGLLLDPSNETLRKLNQLVQTGVQLAVDDFGVGHSSLAYLKTFPLHTLKIDRLFVCDLVQSPRDTAIARAIIELSHGLGLKVTAEGVETQAQADILHKLGCDCLQGFLFSRPVSGTEFKQLLKLHGSPNGDEKPNGRWSDTITGMMDSVF